MSEDKGTELPFNKQTQVLATALAQKGTAGTIILGLVLFAIWILPLLFTIIFFSHLPDPNLVSFSSLVFQWTYVVLGLLSLGVLAAFAYSLTRSTLGSIVPTIRAEAEASALMPRAFGGKVPDFAGGVTVKQLSKEVARNRILKIQEALVYRAAKVLDLANRNQIRSNIFNTKDGQWLSIVNGFHVNMRGKTPDDIELSIKILNGAFSSGTAFKYFRPVLSVAEMNSEHEIKWDHSPDREILSGHAKEEDIETAIKETLKAPSDLSWILSIPIPYQVQPFKMACGVLNVDGLGDMRHRDQLMKLLTDATTAAALIGLINRTTDILGGKCHRLDELPEYLHQQGGKLIEHFGIDPSDFDPAECPEPSEDFKNSLAQIKGLEFFKRISTTDVAIYLREQLNS